MPNRPKPYEVLLNSAQAAHDEGDYKIAVILAQTSLEIFTESVLAALYRKRDIMYLKPEFEHLLINYNLANAKVSSLYMTLSGDDINQAPFWSAVQQHIVLRNDLVHEGRDATPEESSRSLQAIGSLIEHVTSHVEL